MVLVEKDLQITLPTGVTGRKFDDAASHGLSHCMKAVDFIVDMDDRIYFIEFKDPDNPKAHHKERVKFVEKCLIGKIDSDLQTKYRDSWLYEFAEGRAKKPIFYLVLIAASALSKTELLVRTEALQRQIPVTGPGDRPWKKPFVAGCAVMNLAAWNDALPHLPASRVGL
ncbi:MAG: hypothetical protein H7836_06420 [Magnetococcus sp. YQC-3]